MNHLTQIAEIIQKLGIMGKDAFIAYLIYDTLVTILQCATVYLIVIAFFHGIKKIIGEDSLKREICRLLRWTDFEGAPDLKDAERYRLIQLIKENEDRLKSPGAWVDGGVKK